MRYICDPHIIPAVMPRDFVHLEQFAKDAAEYATWAHLDVSDGAFSPSKQWPLVDDAQKEEFASIVRGERALPSGVSWEVHLMTNEPRPFGELFAHAGAKRVIAHLEAFPNADEALSALAAWREAGASEVGLALLIGTSIAKLEGVAQACDVVQLMSIAEIGFQGKAFDERALSRVEELHAAYPDLMVSVDGGVSEATVETLVRAGANRLIVGGALAGSDMPGATYGQILERAMRGCTPVQSEELFANG
jgi:ribulose-phosphate 3-epimerase